MESNILSEEQKARMEENRKQALAKRQQRFCTSTPLQASHDVSSAKSNLHQLSNKSANVGTKTTLYSTSNTSTFAVADHKTKAKTFQNNYASSSRSQQMNKAQSFQQNSSIPRDQFYGKVQNITKGQCVLISKDRFYVNMAFCQPVVDVFKTIKSRMYDATERKWSFNIQDHENLLKSVSGLRPSIQVEPLPKAILQVFGSKVKAQTTDSASIPQANLCQVDSVLVSSLMPFQREGVNFGVHLKGRVLIADDMGLGKTLQAICLACYYRQKWPLLVVTPSSVRFDWAQQFKRWVPSLDPERIQVAVTGKDNPAEGLVNIISYDLLSRKVKELAAARFRVIIMDESHFLKNHKTVRTKAALPLLQSAQHVVLLSGTPALSRPSELYTQIVAVCPRMFKFHDFGLRYCEGKEQPWGWDYSGSCNMEELQLLMEERVMIRRLKQDVLSQLPPKRRNMVVLDPVSVATSQALVKASKVMDKKLSGMERQGALLQYFHETCKVKVAAVKNYIADMLAAEKKFIVFAHHQEMLDSIEEVVASKEVQYIRIDGRTSSEQRHFFCQKFQTKDACKVAVLSITAANAGLNLAAASIVVFAELFWNPGILVQAEDRAHRLGQQDSVLVYYLVAQKTADDCIWPLIQTKLQVLGKAGLAGDEFTGTNTTHVKDPRQKKLMDMFEESFLEDSVCEDETDGASSSSKPNAKRSPTNSPTATPKKRKAGGTPSKLKTPSPSRGQTSMHRFFATETINSTSPQKHGAVQSTTGPLFHDAVQKTSDSFCVQNKPRLELQTSNCAAQKDDVCDVSLTEWDDEMEEEAVANLVADVDWADDFDIEPDIN